MVSEKVTAALKVLEEAGIKTNIVTEEEEEESEMKGIVGSDEDEEETSTSESVIEQSDAGKGFQIYADYSNSTKFKRLCR